MHSAMLNHVAYVTVQLICNDPSTRKLQLPSPCDKKVAPRVLVQQLTPHSAAFLQRSRRRRRCSRCPPSPVQSQQQHTPEAEVKVRVG
jgi:hypothetical protein